MSLNRIKKFADIAKKEFNWILKTKPIITETKLRLILKDDSFIEIRYPLETEYSFHWQSNHKILRVNTAPDHKEIKTFPRHIHENFDIKEDTITDFKFSPEENFRRFMERIVKELSQYQK